MKINDQTKSVLRSVLPATREVAVRRLKANGLTKGEADQILNTGLWSGCVLSLKGELSLAP